MIDPINLILKYFRPAASTPDAGPIAAPDVLKSLLPLLVTAIGTLKIVPLTEGERQGFTGKDAVGQRQVSRGLLRLCANRPHLAEKAQVDPATFEEVVKKDENYDILYQVVGEIVQILNDGLLLVRVSLSQGITKVVTYVQLAIDNQDLEPGLLNRVRVYFRAVDLTALEQAQKQADKQQRQDRALRAGQAQLQEAQAALKAQPAIDRLHEAALKGVDPSSLPQLAGRGGKSGKGHKGGKG